MQNSIEYLIITSIYVHNDSKTFDNVIILSKTVTLKFASDFMFALFVRMQGSEMKKKKTENESSHDSVTNVVLCVIVIVIY